MSLESVRKRLEAATPGRPWEIKTDDRYAADRRVAMLTESPQVDVVCAQGSKADPDALADADLIAHAPTDLALLIDVAEAAQLAACLPRTKESSAVLAALDAALARLEAS